MNTVMLLVATATIGIDVGWEPLTNGGVEYIIQVQPELLEKLQAGKDLVSELPAGLEVRKYRITVGNAELPRQPSLNELRDVAQQAAAARKNQERDDLEVRKREAEEHAQLIRDREQFAEDAAQLAKDREQLIKDGEQLAKIRAALGETKAKAAAPPQTPTRSEEPGAVDEGADNSPQRPKFGQGEQASGSGAPNKLLFPEGDPMGSQQTGFRDPADDAHTSKKLVDAGSAAAAKGITAGHAPETAKPWIPLLLAVVLLFVSLSGNLYLGWVAWGERNRSRGLLEKLHAAGGA